MWSTRAGYASSKIVAVEGQVDRLPRSRKPGTVTLHSRVAVAKIVCAVITDGTQVQYAARSGWDGASYFLLGNRSFIFPVTLSTPSHVPSDTIRCI